MVGEIDLYGRNWDRMPMRVGKVRTPAVLRRIWGRAWQVGQRLRPDPLYAAAASATKGAALSKSATIAQYRFALCFENSILNGWMTEKLFDCFFSGTIPVYWGAPDVLASVPGDCFIDMRQFKDFADLGVGRGFRRCVLSSDGSRLAVVEATGRVHLVDTDRAFGANVLTAAPAAAPTGDAPPVKPIRRMSDS